MNINKTAIIEVLHDNPNEFLTVKSVMATLNLSGEKSMRRVSRELARIGLRPGQIYGVYKRECGGYMYGIQKKDIDFRKKKIRVYFLRDKKYLRKEVPADDTAIDNTTIVKLAEYTAKMDSDDYVFNSISCRQFLRLPKINAKRARIAKEISFHSFRDIYMRQLCKKGLSLSQTKDLAGLADLEGIMRYADPPTAEETHHEIYK